jgi:glycerophosphoryl diester phosphodiesterase
MRRVLLLLVAGLASAAPSGPRPGQQNLAAKNIQVGPRPYYLVDDMDDGPLKRKLESCSEKPITYPPQFSISHRGGPLQFPGMLIRLCAKECGRSLGFLRLFCTADDFCEID